MADQFIKSVLETEEECRRKEADAKSLADTKKQNAKLEAERIVAEAKESVEKMLKDDAEAIAKSSDKQMEREKLKLEEECRKLSETADKNRSRVTSLVVDMLTAN